MVELPRAQLFLARQDLSPIGEEDREGPTLFMPKKRLTEVQRLQLLEDTKQRLRLEQQARTQARLKELEIEV